MKANIFVIDGINRKIVEKIYSKTPRHDAEKIAMGYFEKGEGKPKHKKIPADKYPNRFGIETPTDFFVHYMD